MRIIRILTISILILVAQKFVIAESLDSPAVTKVHATFIEGEKSLANRIKFPKGKEDVSFTIRCAADVSASGRFLSSYCYSDGTRKLVKFERAIMKPTTTSSKRRKSSSPKIVLPALIAGKNRSIWFQYSVKFSRSNGLERIETFPHHGWEVDRYGTEYLSAQRYELNTTARAPFLNCPSNINLMVLATITSSGDPENARINGGSASDVCKKSIITTFLQGKFIPAKVDSEFVASIYAEAYFGYSGVKGH